MLDSADMLYFFPHEFAGLRAGRLSLASVLAGTFNHFLFRHVSGSSLSGLSNRAVLVFLRSGLNARTGSSHGSFHSFDEAVKEKWLHDLENVRRGALRTDWEASRRGLLKITEYGAGDCCSGAL